MNASTKETPSRPTHDFTLDNGLRVIVREDHRKAEFYSTLLYKVGSSYEHPDEQDISSIVMNALVDDYDHSLVEEVGGDYFNYAAQDSTCIELQMPRGQLETAFVLQSTVMKKEPSYEVFRRHWDDSILKSKEKSSFISATLFSPELEALIETGSSYYQSPEGMTASLERLNLEKIRHWQKTWYGPNNAVLVVAGDVEPDEVKRLAEHYFGDIAQSDVPDRPFILGPSEPGYRQITQHLDTKRPLMLIIFNVPSLVTTTEPHSLRALQVLSSAHLDPAFTGAHLSPPASNMPRFNRGDTRLSLAFHFEGDPGEAEAHFWALLEDVKRTPFSQAELVAAIENASNEQKNINDTLSEQSVIIGLLVANGLPWELIDLEIAQLESVTPDDIQKAAQTYLIRERATVGYIFPMEQ